MKDLTIFLLFVLVTLSSVKAAEELQYDRTLTFGRDAINQDDFFDYKPADVKTGMEVGAQCGKISIDGSFKAALKKIKGQFRNQLDLSKLVAASPLLAACHYSPALCKGVQSYQELINFMTKFNFNQCAIQDKYIKSRGQVFNRQIANCIGRRNTDDADYEKIKDECYKKHDDFGLNRPFSGSTKPFNRNLVKGSLDWLGIKDDSLYESLMQTVGEVSFSFGSFRSMFGSAGKRVTPYQQERIETKKFKTEVCSIVEIQDVSESISKLRNVDLSKKTDSIITRNVIFDLLTFPYETRLNLCDELASAWAERKVERRIKKLRRVLVESLANPNLVDYEVKMLKAKINLLEEYQKNLDKNSTLNVYQILERIRIEAIRNRENDSLEQHKVLKEEFRKRKLLKELIGSCNSNGRC